MKFRVGAIISDAGSLALMARVAKAEYTLLSPDLIAPPDEHGIHLPACMTCLKTIKLGRPCVVYTLKYLPGNQKELARFHRPELDFQCAQCARVEE